MTPPFVFTRENTFCISLDSRPDRWVQMEKMFEEFQMDVLRWPASTPATLTDRFIDYLTPPQCACAQSHIQLYRHMILHNIPYALILEDDARFDFQWRERLNEFWGNGDGNNDFDILLLNASEPVEPMFQWKLQREQYLTGGYIISLNGAKWVLRHFQNCFYSADWMTTRLQENGRGYSYFPWLVIQEGRDSNIGGQVDADHAKVVRCLANYSIQNNYWGLYICPPSH